MTLLYKINNGKSGAIYGVPLKEDRQVRAIVNEIPFFDLVFMDGEDFEKIEDKTVDSKFKDIYPLEIITLLENLKINRKYEF